MVQSMPTLLKTYNMHLNKNLQAHNVVCLWVCVSREASHRNLSSLQVVAHVRHLLCVCVCIRALISQVLVIFLLVMCVCLYLTLSQRSHGSTCSSQSGCNVIFRSDN